MIKLRGPDFLRHPHFNKGSAFTREERTWLQIGAQLPPYVDTLEVQIERAMTQIKQDDKTPIQRYVLLRQIQDTNIVLFYAVIMRDPIYFLPIIYTPVVGEACQKFHRLPQSETGTSGLYISLADRGRISELLTAYKGFATADVDVIVVTDGSRILGLGDLGTNGMGIPVGKCALYVAGAGINPRRVLPITLDVGTENVPLRNDPAYGGLRQPRSVTTDDEYYSFFDEFMSAANSAFPNAVIQHEDFSNNHCFDLLSKYRNKYLMFNDDIQGTGAVVAAGFLNAVRLSGVPAQQHTIVVFGAGSAAVGVVESIVSLLAHKYKLSQDDLIQRIYLIDTKGLVTNSRGDKLAPHKVAWARKDIAPQDNAKYTTLLDVVRHVKPTALIGLGATANVFTRDIIEMMLLWIKRPIIFGLSNPSSKCEIIPADAYTWSNGAAIVASGSPFPSLTVNDASGVKTYSASQGNNMYLFPGLGLACVLARAKRVSDETLMRTAAALAELVSDEELKLKEALYPPLTEIRRVSAHVAAAAIMQFQAERVVGASVTGLPTSYEGLIELAQRNMWVPQYEGRDFYVQHLAASNL